MRTTRILALLTVTALVGACGNGETVEQSRNVALTVKSTDLPFAATNASPYDVQWSEEAQRAVAFSADATFEGLWTGSSIVLKSSDPTDESVTSKFPVGTSEVNSVVPDGESGWYVGGRMWNYAGSDKDLLVHVKADGSVDNMFTFNFEPRQTQYGNYAQIDWVAMHPNGVDLLVAASQVSKIDGAAIEVFCPQLYVLDRTTGRRKVDMEPDRRLYGCVWSPALVGNRVLMKSNGNGAGIPAVISIDLTTKQRDTFLDAANTALPYFFNSQIDQRIVSDIVVRDGVIWVFGNLTVTGGRVLKLDAATGAVMPFQTQPMLFAVGNETMVDYAVNDGHVLVHAGELGPEGEYIDTFRAFDAVTGASVPWQGDINGWGGSWAVDFVMPWGRGFLLVGPMRTAENKPVRGMVVVKANGRVEEQQPPFVIAEGSVGAAFVFEFPDIDRTFVNLGGNNLLYDAYYTGPILVTDKEGAPVKMAFGDELTGRTVSGFGVIGKWLYLASDDDAPGNDLSWVDRYDLVTGERDAKWRLKTPGNYVWDVRGDSTTLSLSVYVPSTEESSIALYEVATLRRSAVVSRLSDGREFRLGESVVADGHLYIKLEGRGEGDVPPVLKVNLATGATVEAEIIGGSESYARPTVHDGKVYAPWDGAIHVFDAETLRRVGQVDVESAQSVAFTEGRMVATGASVVEVDPGTLQVLGAWGPPSIYLSRVTSTSTGIVASVSQPSLIAPSVMASGVIALTPDGSLITKTNHSRLQAATPTDNGLANIGQGVRAVPTDPEVPGAPLSVPEAILNGTGSQRGGDRASILSVTAGDRAATVRFRPVGGAGSHTVRTVGGTKSCKTSGDTCTVKGLTAGVAYRFFVVPGADASGASDPSHEVRPWIAMKKGTSKKAATLLKVPGKGKVSWKTKGKACGLNGVVVAARAKGSCSLTVSVATKTGTVRSTLFIKVS
jgi:hypothetical protein